MWVLPVCTFASFILLRKHLLVFSKHTQNAPNLDTSMNAVVYVGPHKTGSTTIQHYSKQFARELANDNYEMPWYRLSTGQKNQVNFATCFLNTNNPINMRTFTPGIPVKKRFPCSQALLKSGLEIANQSHSILLAAETFDFLNLDGVSALSQYLIPWNNVTIILSYRRYYEWIASYHNQLSRGDSWKIFHANATEKLRPSIFDNLCDSRWLETITQRYTLYVAKRFKNNFTNVVVMNLHDTGEEFVKDFYCNVVPHARSACKAIERSNRHHNYIRNNTSVSLVYEDIAYAAHRKGMINIKEKNKFKFCRDTIQAYQEKVLNLSSSDFSYQCPPHNVLKHLREVSLQAERELLPAFYSSVNGEIQLTTDFEIQSKTLLCEVDMAATLETPVWKHFFNSLEKAISK